jgi:MMP 1-O-methyltransferase
MSFTEDWFSDSACAALAELAKQTNHLDGLVIEIGSWEGKSTCALAKAVAPADVHAVDTWHGSPGEISAELAQERDVFATFRQNVVSLTEGNVVVHVCGWRDYLKDDVGPVRFCFIDAEHTYTEVRDNIAAILPHVVEGGIVCGDDVHHEPVRRAVLEAFPDARAVGPVWFWQKPASTLEGKYRQACATPSDINEHLSTLVSLVEGFDAHTVIELGTRGGVSTVAWLYGLARTDGHLWSVDIDPAPDFKHERWTFVQGDDCDPEVFKQLPEADIVFVDTSHMYDHTVRELSLYRWKARRALVLHDTNLRRPIGWTRAQPEFPVRVAVEEFCADEGLTPVFFEHNNGLAVIRL